MTKMRDVTFSKGVNRSKTTAKMRGRSSEWRFALLLGDGGMFRLFSALAHRTRIPSHYHRPTSFPLLLT